MFKKQGLPAVGDFVVCTVRKVNPHSVFCELDEYEKAEGVVYSSEMDRRTVRSMRVFFKPGKQIVCKVMDVDKTNGHINLSLKRVGEGQRRSKILEWKNEKRADELLQAFGKQSKIKPEKIHDKFIICSLKKYGSVYPCLLEEVKSEDKVIEKVCTDKALSKKLCEFLATRLTIPKITITGILTMQSNAPDGISVIKKAVKKAKQAAKEEDATITIKYLGSPKYQLTIQSKEPKVAGKTLEIVLQALENYLKKTGSVNFIKK